MKNVFKRNWQSSFTYDNRYEKDGVIDKVFEYVRITGKKNLVIMDVGCSSAIALKYMKFILEGNGISVTKTIGVDPSPKIKNEAEKNVDEFIPQDILKVKDGPDKADLVVCCKMTLFVQPKHRVDIISKCSKFLMNDGGLITDADRYEVPKMIPDIIIWCQDYVKTLYSIRNGLMSFFRAIKETQSIRHKRKMFLITNRETADKYAQEILEGWNKLNMWDKFDMHCRNFHQRIAARFNMKPIKKKRRHQRLL